MPRTSCHIDLPRTAGDVPKPWLQNVLGPKRFGESSGNRRAGREQRLTVRWEDYMHKRLLVAGISAIAMALSSTAMAQDLMFPKGEGAFSWDALEEFAASHTGMEGQRLTIWGPWREGGDQE